MVCEKQDKRIKLFIGLALLLNFAFWFTVRDVRAKWNNVPPVPSTQYADSFGLGDKSFAYRSNGLMIQNLGDTGGRVAALKDYNFERLTEWFYFQDALDPISNYIPYLAAYYFGGVQEPEKFRPVLDYLEHVGLRPEGEKWRFLVQAIFIARFYMKDLDKALELSNTLAKTDYDDAPNWVKQMPAFVMTEQGEKQAAYALMLEILRTRGEKLHPNEVNAMRAYMCTRTLTEEEAAQNPLCENLN